MQLLKILNFIDLGVTNLVENSFNCNVDVIVRLMTNDKTISNFGIQYRKSGTEVWEDVSSSVISSNSDVNLQHGFDKEIRGTITNMQYKHSYN